MPTLRTTPTTYLLGAALLMLLSAAASAANWPQWRGPSGQGVSLETALPTTWSSQQNIVWKVPLPGRGHSAPVVWGNHIFLTTAVEGDVVPGHAPAKHLNGGEPFVHPDSVGGTRRHTLKVIALDAATGKTLWERTAHDGPVFDDRHRRSSYASTTAVVDGERVYAYFGPEGVYAYTMNGTLVWKTSVGKIKTLGLGVGSSPVLYRDVLIIQCDDDEGQDSAIVALDKRTGREVWRSKRAITVSWSTPVLVETSGRTELVTNGSEWIISYDPLTGRELWRVRGVESNAIHTPLVGDGLVVFTAGFPDRRVIAIRPGGSGDVTNERIAWRYDKGTAYVVSPILYKGVVYLLNDRGVITALDAQTGKVIYEGGRIPKPATFMASPVAFADYVLLTSEDGETFFIKAGATHGIAYTNSLDEPVYSSLALANGRIYIRGERHLYAIGA